MAHTFEGASGRQWFTELARRDQVRGTNDIYIETLKKANLSISLLKSRGIDSETIANIKSQVKQAINRAEIAAVAAREYDFSEQMKKNTADEEVHEETGTNKSSGKIRIITKTKTTTTIKV